VPDRRSVFRLLALAGFLLAVAFALWLTESRPVLVIVGMTAALAVAWTVEWLSWRQDTARTLLARIGDEKAREDVALGEEKEEDMLEPKRVPQEPEPAETAETEPPMEPEPPSPPRPPLRPVPSPPPEPAPPQQPSTQPPAAAASARPAASQVVDMRMRVTAQPRRWNLWELERRAHEEVNRDPARFEEWSYLFIHLRQFAAPDGSLPTEFDRLVRDSFADLLHPR
jgi:outer membrane biosynthesis protein TonB